MSAKLDDYFMKIAEAASQLATCPRASVGAVIVAGGMLISTGYNGAPSKAAHCVDVGCHIDGDGHCLRSVHAELNALLQAGKLAKGATLYTTHRPCLSCTKAIINARIVRIVYRDEYQSGSLASEFLRDAHIEIQKWEK